MSSGENIVRHFTQPERVHEGLPEEHTCAQCKSVLKDAREMPCGCRYCRTCIDGMVASAIQFCPGDSQRCQETALSTSKSISSLPLSCPDCLQECLSGDLEAHCRVCPSVKIFKEQSSKSVREHSWETHKREFQGLKRDVEEREEVVKMISEKILGHLKSSVRSADESSEKLRIIAQSSAKMATTTPRTRVARWWHWFWPQWGSAANSSEHEHLVRSVEAAILEISHLGRRVEDALHSLEEGRHEEVRSSGEMGRLMCMMEHFIWKSNCDRDENKSTRNEIESLIYKNMAMRDESKSIKYEIERMKDENESIKEEISSMKADIDRMGSQGHPIEESVRAPEGAGRGAASCDEWVIEDDIGRTDWASRKSASFSGPAPCYSYLLESANSVAEGALRVHLLIAAGSHDALLDWPLSAAVTLSVAGSKQTRQCRIERPPDERYRCRHSVPFEFPHSDFSSYGLDLRWGVSVSCHIVPGEGQ